MHGMDANAGRLILRDTDLDIREMLAAFDERLAERLLQCKSRPEWHDSLLRLEQAFSLARDRQVDRKMGSAEVVCALELH
jgi:hypothetical protein